MSKSLEALERLTKRKASNSDVTLIKRELKALEVIKDKHKIINYNLAGIDIVIQQLAQEEYDLLKKVLL